MPKIEIDYANTIIYKIVYNDLNITECYVGHTTNFVKRKCQHKNTSVNEKGKQYNYKLYRIIRANGGWKNYSMIEVAKYPCNNANEACAKEREIYEKLSAALNSYNPYRSMEWHLENKEQIAAYKHEYHKINKEKNAAYHQEYRKINKVKIAEHKLEYNEINKEQIAEHKREHYKINKEKISAHSKEYREVNKEKISIKNKQRFVCECGKEIKYRTKARHQKTKVHNDFFLVK